MVKYGIINYTISIVDKKLTLNGKYINEHLTKKFSEDASKLSEVGVESIEQLTQSALAGDYKSEYTQGGSSGRIKASLNLVVSTESKSLLTCKWYVDGKLKYEGYGHYFGSATLIVIYYDSVETASE